MTTSAIAHQKIVSQEESLATRKDLLMDWVRRHDEYEHVVAPSRKVQLTTKRQPTNTRKTDNDHNTK
jgi:hypothetical protein